MKIIADLNEWRALRKTLAVDSLGFVPTMGNLHQGHASLYERSRKENACTVASIFVNPTQFNQAADYQHYPRTLEADLAVLNKLGIDYCLLPEEASIYPQGYRYQIQESQESLLLEGAHRPGHFTGVLTVVMKLLNLVQPTRAYFGEKDYQQYQLIQAMAQDFFMDCEILACPTIREPSQLPFSSRNNRLNAEEKALAAQFASIFHQDRPIAELVPEIEALGLKVEYLQDHQGRRFVAASLGAIRLIDNFALA